MLRANPEFEPLTAFTTVTSRNRDTGLITYQTAYSEVVTGKRREWSGSRTPGYRSKTRNAKLPDNFFRSDAVKCSGTEGVVTANDSSNRTVTTYSNVLSRDTFHPYAYGDKVTDEARVKALSRLGENVKYQKFNAGVAFAERKQTANLISTTAYRIADAARSLRRGNLLGVYKSLGLQGQPTRAQVAKVTKTPADKRLASHWLEYNFGVVPLLRDVQSAAELLASHVSGDLYHTTAVGTATYANARSLNRNQGHPFNGVIVQDVRVRFKARYRLDSMSKAVLSQTGITNPLAVAWELVPYSFVVDWFLPVGNYLQMLYAFDGFELTGGYTSTLWKGTMTKDYNWGLGAGTGSTSTGSSSYKQVRYTRVPMTDWPSVALPQFRNPLENGPLWKFLTSMSLMRQLFK